MNSRIHYQTTRTHHHCHRRPPEYVVTPPRGIKCLPARVYNLQPHTQQSSFRSGRPIFLSLPSSNFNRERSHQPEPHPPSTVIMATNIEAAVPIPPATVPNVVDEKREEGAATAQALPPAYPYELTDEDGQGEWPTEEEFHTLRRVADKIPWRVYTVAFIELCERFSYYGTTVVCKFSSSVYFLPNYTDELKSPTSSSSRFHRARGPVLDSRMARVVR